MLREFNKKRFTTEFPITLKHKEIWVRVFGILESSSTYTGVPLVFYTYRHIVHSVGGWGNNKYSTLKDFEEFLRGHNDD